MSGMRGVLVGDTLNLEKVNCLIVDDNQQSLDIIATICAGFGIRNVTKCLSVAEAMLQMQKKIFDFVLTDAQMPEVDGYTFVSWIRRKAPENNRYVPAILITGHTRVSQILRARDCGAQFTIVKPVTPKVLLERIFWVARDERTFIDCTAYCGPDRRFKREGPPPGTEGRRADDLPPEIGEAVEENMSQDEINALMKPAKVSI